MIHRRKARENVPRHLGRPPKLFRALLRTSAPSRALPRHPAASRALPQPTSRALPCTFAFLTSSRALPTISSYFSHFLPSTSTVCRNLLRPSTPSHALPHDLEFPTTPSRRPSCAISRRLAPFHALPCPSCTPPASSHALPRPPAYSCALQRPLFPLPCHPEYPYAPSHAFPG